MTFEEALSRVIADYQETLEARLLARLRERYDVQTFPERLDRAFEGVETSEAETSAEATGAAPER